MSNKTKIVIIAIFVVFIYGVFYLTRGTNVRTPKEPTFDSREEKGESPFGSPGVSSKAKVADVGNQTITKASEYAISINSNTGLYQITVLGSPFETARILAEQQFLYEVGLDEERACNLNVVISTPSFANPNDAGKNYGLSFCEE